MKVVRSFFVLLLLREVTSGIVRKPPAFSTPIYSDSYLPAAMQVIFHAVEQLKLLEAEELPQNSTTASSSSSSVSTMSHTILESSMSTQKTSSMAVEISTRPNIKEESSKVEEKDQEKIRGTTERVQSSSIQTSQGCACLTTEYLSGSTETIPTSSNAHQESPEVNEETPETNYATPEVNYEVPETNQEVPEENQEESSVTEKSRLESSSESKNPGLLLEQITSKPETSDDKKKIPTIDSIVDEIYEIVKPTPSVLLEEQTEVSGESKSSSGMSIEKMESIEEEEEETRFTLLGEKVAQVPRPSLTSYLRRAKVPPSGPLQQLASLYDSLSKDARKQGFGKYTGYSDDVLKTLETSAEGGIGPQLKKILEKVLERNELTREDARMRTSQTLRDLDDHSGKLNKSLRRLSPLRYSP